MWISRDKIKMGYSDMVIWTHKPTFDEKVDIYVNTHENGQYALLLPFDKYGQTFGFILKPGELREISVD